MSQWELLVTEGHIRAARWRKALPALLALSIAALFLGAVLARSLPEPQPSATIADAKAAYAAAQRDSVGAFLQGRAQALAAPPAGLTGAPTPDALAQRVEAILEALRQDDELPNTVVVQDTDAFWRGDWGTDEIHAVMDGRTILIGAFVTDAYQAQGYRAPLRRGFWILRRPEASWIWRDRAPYDWTRRCLALAGALPCTDDAVDPAAIPATMRGLLPSAAFEARP